MKPFVINRYGRIVFPFNFFPALDFSVFETLDQFAAVIKRDFEEKAPTEVDIVARVDARAYNGRYDLLRDLALNLFWVNRYAMTMYEKRPMRWRDVPRQRDDVFLPIFKPWDGGELTSAIESGYRALPPTWDEGTEDKISRILLDDFVVVFAPRSDEVAQFIRRVKAGRRVPPRRPAPLPTKAPVAPYPAIDVRRRFAVMPRVEALAVYKGEVVCTNDDLIRNTVYCWSPMTAKEIEEKTGIVERLYTELDLDHIALIAARRALAKAGRRPEEIGAVLFCSCTSAKMMPSLATWLSGQLGMLQTHASCDMVAACAGLPYGLSEAVRLLQEVERPVLVVCGERFSDKIGTVRTSRVSFGDGAAALVIGSAPAAAADLEWFQTYASGPISEVDSIIWPNPAFDNNITVYGPEVKALVKL